MEVQTVLTNVQAIAADFAAERAERQQRRSLNVADFDRLAGAGFLLSGVPKDMGGIWESVQTSTRPVCEMLRSLAGGDSSVALVASMHPAVLVFWLASPTAEPAHQAAWSAQRELVFRTAMYGEWWGTITSEPGSGGDVTRSNTIARSNGNGYRMSGQKHFGSGMGLSANMVTTAVAEGESAPDWFFVKTKDTPVDGTAGITMIAPWDGHGMIATQSHAVEFTDFPATRFAWPNCLLPVADAAGGVIGCYFTAVIVGIVDTAMATARKQLERKHANLRAYEKVEWANAEMEAWLVQQAYAGMLNAVERDGGTPREITMGKTAIADLAASLTGRICKVVGGATFGRYSPFGYWFEDVRALGFLRPPWGIAYDRLINTAWP